MNTDTELFINSLDMSLILEKLSQCSGCDFSHYTKKFIERRLSRIMKKFSLHTRDTLIEKISEDPNFHVNILSEFSILVTDFFRDPDVFVVIREKVIPLLKTYPFIRIWHVGCASGEEVYSMAVILHEMGLLERCKIYATDFNDKVLLRAKQGIFSHNQLKLYNGNYQKAGEMVTF